MQTVYLSEAHFTERSIDPVPPEIARNEGLLELPTCPLCLEKLDSSATGLSSAANILDEAYIAEPSQKKKTKWPFLLEECRVCRI
jgi:hypothetical protein